MPAVASETKVAPYSPAPAARTSGRTPDGGDAFSALVDDSAPPEKPEEAPLRSANSRSEPPATQQPGQARSGGTGTASDKPASTDPVPDVAAGKTDGAAEANALSAAQAIMTGVGEQVAADAAIPVDSTSPDTETDTDPDTDAAPDPATPIAVISTAAVAIPAAAVAIPDAPITPPGTDPTDDAIAADGGTALAVNPAAGPIAEPALKPAQTAANAGDAPQAAVADTDPSTADATPDAETGKPATVPHPPGGKPEETADAKPATPVNTPDDHPAAAHRAADVAANDAAVARTDTTPTPPTLHATQPAHTTAAATQTASTATATQQPVPLHAVAMEIVARAGAGKNRFEIRLDPPELGKIDVRLDIDKRGQVTSHLIVEKAETLDLLRRDAPQLERALQDAGLKTSGNGLQFSLQQQMSQQRDDRQSGHGVVAQILVTEENAATDIAARSYASLAAARGGIDIRV